MSTESSIKITLDIVDDAAKKALSNFVNQAGTADKSLDKLKHSSESTFQDIAVHIGKATGAYEIFEGNIAANVATKAFDAIIESAHALFDTFIVEGVKAAEATQNAINSLNVALAASGHYSKESSEDFVAFAEELQKTTTFSHSAIVSNAALIESLSRLDTDGLKRATKAALDMSAALGKDLPEASAIVAKAAEGNVTALHKMGITIQAGRDNAETFARALTAIEEHFGGAAESKINTYAGAVQQARNSFEDLTEQIGNLIVKNPAVISAVNEIAEIFNELSDSITEQEGALQIAGQGFVTFIGITAGVITGVDAMVRVFQVLYGAVSALSIPFGIITVPVRALTVGLAQATKEFSDFGETARKNLNALGKEGDGALAGIATDLLRVQNAADKGLEALKDGADGSVEPINNAATKTKELTAAQKLAQEQLKAFADALLKQADSAKDASTKTLEIAKAEADKQIAIQDDLLARKKINEVQYLKNKGLIEDQYENAEQQASFKRLRQEQAQNLEALNAEVIDKKQFEKIQLQIAKNFTDEQEKLSTKATEKEIQERSKLVIAEQTLQRQKTQVIADALGNLSSLMHTNSRELFEIGKAAAIASATINTFQAVTKAYSDWGWPLGIIAGAAMAVAGAVQVANIEAQSFETGGIVGGNSFTGDNIQANVNSGEMILTRQQQSTLFDIANGRKNVDKQEMNYPLLAAHIAQAISKQPVVVNVGGKTISDTLRSEKRAGRTF